VKHFKFKPDTFVICTKTSGDIDVGHFNGEKVTASFIGDSLPVSHGESVLSSVVRHIAWLSWCGAPGPVDKRIVFDHIRCMFIEDKFLAYPKCVPHQVIKWYNGTVVRAAFVPACLGPSIETDSFTALVRNLLWEKTFESR